MEVRDLWPESIRAVNAMEDSRVLDWLEKLELFLYRKASKVVVVTDSFKKNIAGRGIAPEKIEVVKNGVHLDKFQPRPRDKALLAQFPQLRDQCVVGYLGTHGMAHKLDFILECAADAPQDVHFLFIGDGAEKPGLLEMKERMGLSNVTFLPPVPKHEIARYISLTDVALVPLNASMEKPILLGVEGESKAIIEKYQAGLCFEPENKADFQKQLRAIATDTQLYQQLQKGCQALSLNFNRKTLAQKLYQIIETVIS